MKFFSKLNRGAILSFFVIIGVITYLIVLNIGQGLEKQKIIDVCTDFLQTEAKYNLLPEKHRVDSPNIPKAELDAYILQMEKDIKAYYTDNEQTYKYTLDTLKNELNNQSYGNDIVYEYKKENLKFDSFNFDKDTVTVVVKAKTTVDKLVTNNADPQRKTQIVDTSDTLILQKTDGVWKLIYSQIGSTDVNYSEGVKMTTY